MRLSVARGMMLGFGLLWAGGGVAEPLKINDKGYYEAQGLNVLNFSNWYDGLFADAKISGIELIHHGVRTVTNGDVRMSPTPGAVGPDRSVG